MERVYGPDCDYQMLTKGVKARNNIQTQDKRMREQGTMVSAGRFVSAKKSETIDLKVPKLLSKNNKKRDLPAFLSGMMSVSKLSSSQDDRQSSSIKKIKDVDESEKSNIKVKLPKIDTPMI